jgi:hypothetical protein
MGSVAGKVKVSVVGWLMILAGFWTTMILGGLAALGQYADPISVIAVTALGLGGMTGSVFVLADLTKGRSQ